MDVNATLQALIEAAADSDHIAVRECASNIRDWMARGGFAPIMDATNVLRLMDVIAVLANEALA